VLEPGHVVDGRRPLVEDRVDLVVDPPLFGCMAAEELEGECQRRGCGLVPGQQEDQRLVTDLLDVHRRAGV
jgi:hypothetical protein